MAGEIQLNSVSLATESSGTVTLNSSTDIKGCLNASGSAPIYACRAWINFDGTSASIGSGRANGNISGVTDNGTGDYTVNFTTAMPDVNFAVVNAPTYTTSGVNSAMIRQAGIASNSTTTSAVRINTGFSYPSGHNMEDQAVVMIAIFR